MARMIVMQDVLNDHTITFITVVTVVAVKTLRLEQNQKHTKRRILLLVYEGGLVSSMHFGCFTSPNAALDIYLRVMLRSVGWVGTWAV